MKGGMIHGPGPKTTKAALGNVMSHGTKRRGSGMVRGKKSGLIKSPAKNLKSG